jgi:hypothetical protein
MGGTAACSRRNEVFTDLEVTSHLRVPVCPIARGLASETRPRYGGNMSPEPPAIYVFSCEACGFVGLRRGTDVMACARDAVRHAGGLCDPTRVLIHPLVTGGPGPR